jgi:hypothetical protein
MKQVVPDFLWHASPAYGELWPQTKHTLKARYHIHKKETIQLFLKKSGENVL